jgi:NAD(P)-dependent dehydrogenase (short-subunit alcohol dehydrogenase family)
MEFLEKTVIVTGGGKGIGKAIAIAFAKNGANLVIADVDVNAAQSVEREIKIIGRDCLDVKTDVSNSKEVCNMVEKTMQKFNHIDILVNNAGIMIPSLLVDTKECDWDTNIDVNLKGVFLCSQSVARYMIKQKSGKIINISSMAGKIPAAAEGAYAAAKLGVIALTKTMGYELAPHGINVNTICPGLINTDMFRKSFKEKTSSSGISFEEVEKKLISRVPVGRLGKPQDVADLVLFLASEKTTYISGQSVNISGGFPSV